MIIPLTDLKTRYPDLFPVVNKNVFDFHNGFLYVYQPCKETVLTPINPMGLETPVNHTTLKYPPYKANALQVLAIINPKNGNASYVYDTVIKDVLCYSSANMYYTQPVDPEYTGLWKEIFFYDLCGRGMYVNGKKDGEWVSPKLITVTNYSNGEKHGKEISYYDIECVKIKEDSTYSNGIQIGISTHYYENGNKKYEKVLDGNGNTVKITKWYENGQLKVAENYINELLNGNYTCYYENGNPDCVGQHRNEEQIGYWAMYYSNGTKKEEGNYINGGRVGRWVEYNEDGTVKNDVDMSIDSMKYFKEIDV